MPESKPDDIVVVRKWNSFIESLILAKQQWRIFLEYRQRVRLNFDTLPKGAGKFLGLATSRSVFDVMLPRLLDYARKYSSLEDMIVKLEEEKKDGRQSRK